MVSVCGERVCVVVSQRVRAAWSRESVCNRCVHVVV